ncbi:MAG: hypothetical protein KGL98_06635 [Gammaproteobacteria bacterium]|nr:hypothetical protein [Gammaproteobacteria bacterium]MBU6508760.1 hypothetical protein [Gammaproteobacteria bacterium]MDE1983066.1 hypothetical protein [Gammaproteobacteria bacterium]MDE2460908.1 hypothetical protein [Gammaproteobacteria bacterium]
MKTAMLISCLLLVLSLTACIPIPLQNYDNVPALGFQNQSLNVKQIERGIYNGSYMQAWSTVTVAPGHIVATHIETPRKVVVDIFFDAHSYSIHYKSSQDMDFNPGTGTINPRYNRWTADLRDSINTALQSLCDEKSGCEPQ